MTLLETPWLTRVGTAGTTVDAEEAGDGRAAQQASGPYWLTQLRYALRGNDVTPLMDGVEAFAAIRAAIETAQSADHFVYMTAWWMDPWVNLAGPGSSLLDLFARAGRQGVQIRVLLWDPPSIAFPGHLRLHRAAVAALNRIPNCCAQLDDAGRTSKAHHQKLLVVNGRNGVIGLVGGVDVNVDRLHRTPPPAGSYRHDRPADLGWDGGSGGSGGSGGGGSGSPLHDVHAVFTGPTSLPLLRMFLQRWWARSGDRGIDRADPLRGRFGQAMPRATGSHWVRVGATFDGTLQHAGHPPHAVRQRDVQDIWLRSLLGARRYIYIEDQYLTNLCAAEAIRRVLPRLEHVTILIAPTDLADLPGLWRRRMEWIHHVVAANPHASKLRIYTRLVGSAQSPRRDDGAHLYIHSKMAVIDDDLLLIGSANCNNRGWESDTELVTATFEDEPAGSSTAAAFRRMLWAHHLGLPLSGVADPITSARLWDTAPSRQVFRYDPAENTDSVSSRAKDSLGVSDPESREAGDPCFTLLGTHPVMRIGGHTIAVP